MCVYVYKGFYVVDERPELSYSFRSKELNNKNKWELKFVFKMFSNFDW